ncbi:MAG: formate dehydrogenase accessory sulfurtransferase FdhD [Anaerolineae bacterium]
MTDAEARRVTYTGHYDADSRPVRGAVPAEAAVTLHVNGEVLVRLMCTPTRLKDLALGFLLNEGLIQGLEDVAVVELCSDGQGIDAWLRHDIEMPEVRAITSGCSGGTTFTDVGGPYQRLESNLVIAPERVTALMERLSNAASLYRRAGGVHVAALAAADGDDALLCVVEDVGRHNTLDKIAGVCLREEMSTRDGVLLTSGRVSSEMVSKAARMAAPVVVSRTSPTSLSIDLAEAWGITLIGYTRRRSFRVYAGDERVVTEGDEGG